MSWTVPVDFTTGRLVSASDWNLALGATGNIAQTAAAKVTTAGDMVYATGANALARLAVGTAGQPLRANAAGTAPEYFTPPQVRVTDVSNQTITTATLTALTFTSETYKNVAALHSTSSNTSRLVADRAGYWLVIGNALWAGGVTGIRYVAIRLNGGSLYAETQVAANASSQTLNVCAVLNLAANDYVELMVNQDSGGNLQILTGGAYSPVFSMAYLGP